MNTNYKAIMFDLDGTLLNTTKDIGLALETTLNTKFTDSQVDNFVGRGLRNAIKDALLFLGQNPTNMDLDKAESVLIDNYRKVPVKYTVPYPQIPNVLERLQNNKIKLGVFSNKEQDLVDTILPICLPKINFCFTAGWHGKYQPKPSSDAIDSFCSQLSIKKIDMLYIGDSDVDYKTAINSNVDYRILTWGTRTREQLLNSGIPQEKLIDNISEILRFFPSLV
ncbi:MAG: HAD family hydrolase [Sphaerochaetaceae bacterium]|nr:HAD family hydrolase [Sphaerochaetaceae bacterium]